MSKTTDVIDMIEELRAATAEDLEPHLPGMTLKQIRACLHQACFNKRIVAIGGGAGRGTGGGRTSVVYGPAPRAKVLPAVVCGMPEPRPICSVWEWGARA
jgi:hypothetical protein